MAQAAPQTFENHARTVPAFHYFTFGLLVINLVWRAYVVVTGFSVDAVVSLLLAVALVMIFFFARIFALTAQDRVIRLEMRLRLAELAPHLGRRFDEFTLNQLVSLRFASDAELSALATKVLDEKLDDRKAIKQMVQEWKADPVRV